MSARGPLIGVLLLAGCAYYNGLYNANRLAREAERAEREGRTGEARSLWSQASVKAESVVSRHPKSRFRDDALYLQGRALERVGSCSQAIPPLTLAAATSPDPQLRAEARLLLGDCRLQLGEPDSALAAVGPLGDEGTEEYRSAAQLLRGRALLQLGRNESALEALGASGAREGAYVKAVALARLERMDEATATLQSVVDGPYVEARWLETLDSVGRRHPASVADLVDRLAEHPEVRDGERARLWLGDGVRWLASGDSAAAERRFVAVTRLVPDSADGRTGRAYRAVFAVQRAEHWQDVPALRDSLEAAVRSGGDAVRVAGRAASVIRRADDELVEGTPMGLFLAAEGVRDSLGSRALAASIFERVTEVHAPSVLAPKALLAIAALRPAEGDSLVGVMQERYPESPYALVLAGTGAAAFEALEDSLRRARADELRNRTRNPRGRDTDDAVERRRVRN